MYFSIKYKYMILYSLLTIFPLIMLELLIYQFWTIKYYDNAVDAQTRMIQQLDHSMTVIYEKWGSDTEKLFSVQDGLVQDLAGGLHFNVPSDLLIMNANGQILYTSNDRINGSSSIESEVNARAPESGNFTIKENKRKMLVIYQKNPVTGLRSISITEVAAIYENNAYLKKWMTYLILLSTVFSVFSIVLISLHVAAPIRSLRKQINAIDDGEFKNTSDQVVIIKDEIWEIGISFQKIMLKLQEQINLQFQLKMATNQSKFKALQSQINPHFLHNTLETINSLAIIHEVPLIAQISRSLSKMFRYNTVQDAEDVLLKEELDHVDHYLKVQLIRFDGWIECEQRIDPQILEHRTIKFILQPIVENCFTHAFNHVTDKGMIRIEGTLEQDHILIRVNDNGTGMPEDKIQSMNEALRAYDSKPEHADDARVSDSIGVYNVNYRLKIAYGEAYGLQYENISPRGLSVRIKIPVNQS
ncbi:histidine kinase [Paenibacillus validus]|uniref:HAMP domain-containing protein n=2 Tax=Paenibacillus validus TaxID=44253 RepID=A0A7X3CS87_9BACL|nr:MULTISPECIES: histidine kinase [Paenibacillus]MED4600472.1 histidine kinase [Paenibacillus validus]MED4604731.1 histidine kinase [Paenibacillus validus]MUG71047.1 hypothetical protein [Paenibacillus validus]